MLPEQKRHPALSVALPRGQKYPLDSKQQTQNFQGFPVLNSCFMIQLCITNGADNFLSGLYFLSILKPFLAKFATKFFVFIVLSDGWKASARCFRNFPVERICHFWFVVWSCIKRWKVYFRCKVPVTGPTIERLKLFEAPSRGICFVEVQRNC